MRRWAMLCLAVVTIAASGLLGVSSSACACVSPMPESELRALIRKADKGDIRATGQVWQEYAHVRGDVRRGRIWASRAIRVGDPDTMESLSADWMREGQRATEKRHKPIFYDAAIRLLENGYRNRELLSACDVGGMNERYLYVAQLRSARAALETARSGPATWIQRAGKGSSSAAYYVANHYFWVELDQKRRGQWERRASELGDPMYAGSIVDWRTEVDDIRDINRALGQKAVITQLGDRWVQNAVISELKQRLLLKRHFASGKSGRPKGVNCTSA